MSSEPAVEYTREYLSDMQQAYELAADEAQGISDYLVAIEDTDNPEFKALLRGILAQEQEHLAKLVAFCDKQRAKAPNKV